MLLGVAGHETYAYTGTRRLDRRRPAIVFLHGAANDHSVWALQSRYFAHHGYDALAVDLPGHGRSAGPALGSVEAIAGWVPRLLDAAGVDRVTLVGHSLGALVALETASRNTGRIGGRPGGGRFTRPKSHCGPYSGHATARPIPQGARAGRGFGTTQTSRRPSGLGVAMPPRRIT